MLLFVEFNISMNNHIVFEVLPTLSLSVMLDSLSCSFTSILSLSNCIGDIAALYIFFIFLYIFVRYFGTHELEIQRVYFMSNI